MLDLVVVALAVFWLWATLRDLLPWSLPSWAHAALVGGGSLAFTFPDWRLAMAGAGGVLLLHLITGRWIGQPAKPDLSRRGPTRHSPLP